jgi:hypothetical protein
MRDAYERGRVQQSKKPSWGQIVHLLPISVGLGAATNVLLDAMVHSAEPPSALMLTAAWVCAIGAAVCGITSVSRLIQRSKWLGLGLLALLAGLFVVVVTLAPQG